MESAAPRGDSRRAPRSLLLLPAALLLGGWRDPRIAALGGAAVWAAVWFERPAIGPAAAWIPWLGWAALAGAVGWQPWAAAAPLARWAAALAFFSLAAAWDAKGREAWIKTVAAVTVVLGAAAFATGIGHGFRQYMTGLIPPYYNYTAFALAGGAAAAAAWAAHPHGPRGRWRWAAWSAAILGFAAIFAARSRGALLGLLVAGGVWSVRRWGGRAAAGALVALALAAVGWRASLIPESVRAAALKKDRGSPDVRARIWESAAATAGENPALGVGPGSFGPAFLRHPVAEPGGVARWGQITDYAHSEIFQAAAETGWVGLALWLAALVAALSGLASRSDAEPAREAAAAAAAAMCAQIAVDNMLQIPGLAFIFFSAAAISGARPTGGRQWSRGAAAAGVVLVLAAYVPRALADADPARAAALFPASASPVEDLAYAAQSAGETARADALWAEASRRAPYDAVYPWRRAQIAAGEERWSDVEALAARAVSLEPGFMSARLLRAQAQARLGRREAAREELAEIRRLVDARGDHASWSGYERTVAAFDESEFARVSALAMSR